MSPELVFIVIAGYFLLLISISYFTSRNSNSETFFTGNRQSPWYLVAFGMIGASLSGITFISVPGEVGNSQFTYLQFVLGFIPGYAFIALVLMPLYYKLNLVSIYGYLEQRFGYRAYKTGAFFFLLSRVIGASLRLFIVAGVLHIAFFKAVGLPFWLTVVVAIALIWLYTFRGGIKTIVWTDTLQTFFMLASLVVSILLIKSELDLSFGELTAVIQESNMSRVFVWDWQEPTNFFKQFIAGAFIAIVMTGLDQDMMQKNLTIKTLKDAQKNVFWFTVILVLANILFLSLGALLYIYANEIGFTIPERSDNLFPALAVNQFQVYAGVIFLLGITAAAYSSADSALTALTTSFCVDFLGIGRNRDEVRDAAKEKIDQRTRKWVHVMFSFILLIVILIFNFINDESVIMAVYRVATYTYGPLLGLYAFGLYTKWKVKDRWIPWVAVLSPLICFVLDTNSAAWFNGFKFGHFLLIINGAITFLGLLLIRDRSVSESV
ncbi:sodium:solute symporter [Tunicatimonas pelagia]|uniref:sodium:solute symporter n=1 Tax=Tunicatimonas pelagia TaxID=931531 RepID=UPI00266698EF|nr:sodium:solute symporter [Tunicatimonas pelagia]WKN41828.1 sodium:solute symporter [Tunicatimonas pelagia]